MSAERAQTLGLKPLVKVVAHASAAHAPEWFTTAPGKAIEKVLQKAELTVSQIDLWEINEAFAPVLMAAVEDHKLSMERVNVHGGAIALGHPIGASGARILTTLIHALEIRSAKRGLATLCIGGGEASALIVERV
jgi:acetyl-CoA C-acetyltransferase